MSIITGPNPESVTLTAALTLTAVENFSATDLPSISSSSGRRLTHDGFNLASTGWPDAVITPNGVSAGKLTMTSGVTTIDLTAAIGALDRYLNFVGDKVFAFLFHAPSANAGTINIKPGASNPYPLFGTANDIDMPKGRRLCVIDSVLNLAAVSGTVKTIDITGTAGDILYFEIVVGEAT